jgi:TRAP-type C4-dicarboxylate transport system substrate-binding protein
MRLFKILIPIVIVMSLVFPTAGFAKSSEPIKLRLGTMVVAANPIAQGAKYFAERMYKETNGRVQIDVFTDAALGSHGQMYESMKEGVLDMCTNSPILLGPYIPEYQIYELPYIFQSIKSLHVLPGFQQELSLFLTQPQIIRYEKMIKSR